MFDPFKGRIAAESLYERLLSDNLLPPEAVIKKYLPRRMLIPHH